MPSLQVRRLSKSYPGTGAALEGVDLEAEPGDILGVIGANGSGKTTLLKILAGRLGGYKGSVQIYRRETGHPDLRAHVGYVSQEQALDPEMTGRETTLFFARLRGLADPRATSSAFLEAFGLSTKADSPLSNYSGGMRQRLHVLLEFMHDPELILMDEATTGLDPDGKELLWKFLRNFSGRGGIVLVSTHDLHEASKYCSRVVFMAGGSIKADGPAEDLVAKHGAWLWEGTLMPSSSAGARQALKESLGAFAWLRSHDLQPHALALWLGENAPQDPEILSILQGLGLDIEAYQRRRPDLASAYHHLTGENLIREKRTGPGNGKIPRGQGRARNVL